MTNKKEARTANSTYKKLAVQCSADSFVVAESFVLRINISGENRQLLVAANRYEQSRLQSLSISANQAINTT